MILIWDYVRLSVCLTRYDKVYSPNDSVMVSYVNEYAYHQNFLQHRTDISLVFTQMVVYTIRNFLPLYGHIQIILIFRHRTILGIKIRPFLLT